MSSEPSKTTEPLLQVSPLAPPKDGSEDTPKINRGYLSEREVLALVEESWGIGPKDISPRMIEARILLRKILSGTAAGGYFVSFSGPDTLIKEIKELVQLRKIEISADELVRAIESHRIYRQDSEPIEGAFLELQRMCSWNMTRALVALSAAESRAEVQSQ